MRVLITCVVITVLLILYVGCASSERSRDSRDVRYTANIGTATLFDLREGFRKIIQQRYSYEVEEYRESSSNVYIETRWQEREPFKDEMQLGVDLVRTRVIVNARPRTRSGFEGSALYTIRLMAERQVIKIDETGWAIQPLSDESAEYFNAIAREFEIELRAGYRRF